MLLREDDFGIIVFMEGFSEKQKEELREIVGGVVGTQIDSLAQMVQVGFAETVTKTELRSELEKVHERLIKIDDKISYQKGRDDLIEGRIDKVQGRVAVLEGKR